MIAAGKFLKKAVELALLSTEDAGGSELTAFEFGLQNEPFVHSYVGIGINDLLRAYYHRSSPKGKDKHDNRLFVTFETSVSWIDDFMSDKRQPGRPAGKVYLSDRSRFDLLAWSSDGFPRVTVEIKNQFTTQMDSLNSDIKKLCAALNYWNKLKYSIFIFSLRHNSREFENEKRKALTIRFEEILKQFECNLNNCYISHKYLADPPTENSRVAWGGIAISRIQNQKN